MVASTIGTATAAGSLLMAAGLVFHALVAPGVVEDLEEMEE